MVGATYNCHIINTMVGSDLILINASVLNKLTYILKAISYINTGLNRICYSLFDFGNNL